MAQLKDFNIPDGTALFPLDHEHRNHAEMGFVCPHCHHKSTPDFSVTCDPKAFRCPNCFEPFAVWHEEVVENLSGFFDADDILDDIESGQ